MRSAIALIRVTPYITGLVLAACLLAARASAQAAPDGTALFKEHCSMCHISGDAKGNQAPQIAVLAQKTQEEILQALESGPMVIYGNRMSEAQRHAVAAFLTSKVATGPAASQANLCKSASPITTGSLFSPDNWNGWGRNIANWRYQSDTLISAENVAGLKLKWAFGIPNASTAYGQPNVIAGRVFFGSGDGTVYALDARSGCTIWTYRADTTVRSAVTVGAAGPNRYVAYFGDGEANLYAVDAENGKLLWKVRVDSHRSARITAGSPSMASSATSSAIWSTFRPPTAPRDSWPCSAVRSATSRRAPAAACSARSPDCSAPPIGSCSVPTWSRTRS